MLKTKKNITLTGESFIGSVVAEQYQAVIDSNNPDDMTISTWQRDKAAYKANRSTCHKDRSDFEDMAYTLQEELLAELEEV